MFLHLETPEWPGHFGGLAVVEDKALVDDAGRLRMGEIQTRIDRRLAHVPQLRRRLCFPGPLGGKPLWVDDQRFDIRHHVHQTAVAPPGGDLELLDTATRIYGHLLNRGRPLWELWFLTGVSNGRIGVLLKLHHSVADGTAAVAIIGSLFDLQPDAPHPGPDGWVPESIPGAWSLIADNLSRKVWTVIGALGMLTHPPRLIRQARLAMHVARETLGRADAPRTSLNQVVRSGRRVQFLRLNLDAMKEAAQSHGAKVNDVVLDLWSGGLRELMLQRGELVAGVELITDIPVSLRPGSDRRTAGNEVGFMALPMPVWEPDVHRRLDRIAGITRRAKTDQQTVAMAGVLAAASAMPFAKSFAAHQHSVNVRVSNLMGPPVPVYVLGTRVLEILPIMRLFGNVGLTLCAFSYAGQISLVVTADAGPFPDLDVLMAGMKREWRALTDSPWTEPIEDAIPKIDTVPLGR